jgi:hypothetical protein
MARGFRFDGDQQRLIAQLASFFPHRYSIPGQFTSPVKTSTPSTPSNGLTSSNAGAGTIAALPSTTRHYGRITV